MTPTQKKVRSVVLTSALTVGLAAGATSAAVAAPSAVACSATAQVPAHATAADLPGCDPVGIPVELGEPTEGATDTWQSTETDGVGYKVPADWAGEAIVGDGGAGHEWTSPEIAVSDQWGDLHWRILVQSPFYDQEMPDPEVLNELGWYASSIDVEGASEAVLTAAQTGHWADPSVETIDFQVFVQSETTGVVTRFMGELPAGEEGQFLLDNFVPTIEP
ncbi:hypothetical protein ACFQHV_17545 [Promicromonospora thailandica]|uniref:Alternate signal-mediated exported protein n=1 Tax=Promicromonospora thailandica TaxID=765201 RepID=A0A9X2JWJ8_9MICO|nr:hypothetical protein [Promicromonospora thailandica]MCP2265622.1 hypothetical protein [Promicromonospora thailandica]BFF21625.1 hypothetical protein GCM10025730_51460 [Promicromonospora thailandica]